MPAGIRLLLVDGLNLIRRVYAAQPGEDGTQRAEDGRTASVQSLERALRETAPSHAVVVFEGDGPTWRHEAFPGYKAGHSPMPDALHDELPRIRAAFAELGVRSFELPATEADDVIATLAAKTAASGGRAIILSTDKIFLQLLSERIGVRDHFQRADREPAWVRERFGVGPQRFVDYLALAGDSTNAIPGVPGIGPKTAARLLGELESLDELLAEAKRASGRSAQLSAALARRLVEHEKEARLARRLVRLVTDLELGLNLRLLRYRVSAADAEPASPS